MVTRVVTVGIGGGSGSGKTSLCRAVSRLAGASAILDLDSYYLDRSALSPEQRADLNFDEPGAFDVGLLGEHVRELAGGRPIEKPRYSFVDHRRDGFERVEPAPIVLVEGLFTLWWEELLPALDLRVFVHAPADVRLARRIRRDVESRGRTRESVLAQYAATVSAMHERYVEPTRWKSHLVVVNDGDLDRCVGAVWSAVRRTALGAGRPCLG